MRDGTGPRTGYLYQKPGPAQDMPRIGTIGRIPLCREDKVLTVALALSAYPLGSGAGRAGALDRWEELGAEKRWNLVDALDS